MAEKEQIWEERHARILRATKKKKPQVIWGKHERRAALEGREGTGTGVATWESQQESYPANKQASTGKGDTPKQPQEPTT